MTMLTPHHAPTARNAGLRKVMVIGSGPIVIGQAAEFDYAGTQACQALREEGIEVVLVNNNPATIMTDPHVADRVYLEPLTVESLTAIIAIERPDGLLPTLGGQMGLNLAVGLAEAGVLERYDIRVLGTSLAAIRQAEDRECFKALMQSLGQPIPASAAVHSLEEAEAFCHEVGLPLIIRPAYTMGGAGGGIAETPGAFVEIVRRGLSASPIGQILLERSIKGWKEIEYEVMRDGNDTCITICNMENLDPVGVHTGDSIVVAPSQTLSDREYQMLRQASITIIRALKIEGGCNVQFGLNPESFDYAVIEVNPRVSRSSALASKATGYPIARMAAKIAIGQRLDEIVNPITGVTKASFEPALDYVVVKIPRWPFDKFPESERHLGTQMKATGEVMAIGRSFEESLQKAIRSLETGVDGLYLPEVAAQSTEALIGRLQGLADDSRLYVLGEALRRGIPWQDLHEWTRIDPFFLTKLDGLIRFERTIQAYGHLDAVPTAEVRRAKRLGFADSRLATLLGTDEATVRRHRLGEGIAAGYKLVDTCAAEFPALTPYFYSSYQGLDEGPSDAKPKVLVLGSGPIRIGQGIEFDYCAVHAAHALREAGMAAVMINSNPETVSTDFDVADRLYFEPLALEDVLNVIDKEQPIGVFAQFGGQTAINLAGPLAARGIRVMGTSVEAIDLAEDRDKFRRLLDELGIAQTKGGSATDLDSALTVANDLGYPLMIRPSYVIGGRAMRVLYDEADLRRYLTPAMVDSLTHPVLLDQYLPGKEVDVDAICDGETVVIPGIFEHIERAGVHSGDSITVYPPQTLTEAEIAALVATTTHIAKALPILGLVNLQFVFAHGQLYVLEVNPRASRTVPILSKVTGVPMVRLATRILLGQRLQDMGYPEGLYPARALVAVKAPVFSFEKMRGVDIFLGPEMKSTGEALGVDRDFDGALAKVFHRRPRHHDGTKPALLCAITDRDKAEAGPLVANFARLGWTIYATPATARALETYDLGTVSVVAWDAAAIGALLRSGAISIVLNTPTQGKDPERKGFQLRRLAVDFDVPCLTALDTAASFYRSLLAKAATVSPIQQYLDQGPAT